MIQGFETERGIICVLKDIITKILSGNISKKWMQEQIYKELETKNIWEAEDFMITDCYYALKHIDEENISIKEWEYFLDCFNGIRKYDVKDKMKYILKAK